MSPIPSAWLSMRHSASRDSKGWSWAIVMSTISSNKNEKLKPEPCNPWRYKNLPRQVFFVIIKGSSGQGVIPDRRWLLRGNVLFLLYFVAKLCLTRSYAYSLSPRLKEKSPFPCYKRSPRAQADVVWLHNRQYSLDGRRRETNRLTAILICLELMHGNSKLESKTD